VALTALTFLVLDAASLRNVVYLAAVGVIPPVMLISLWTDGPSLTAAQVLRPTENRR
jgi:hypothetical protein